VAVVAVTLYFRRVLRSADVPYLLAVVRGCVLLCAVWGIRTSTTAVSYTWPCSASFVYPAAHDRAHAAVAAGAASAQADVPLSAQCATV
jgi:hypothetical protein